MPIDYKLQCYNLQSINTKYPRFELESVIQLEIEITKAIDEADCTHKAKDGDRLSMHYTGYFPDGKQFDSSYNWGEPYAFTLGAGQVIKGWDQVNFVIT